MTFNLPNLFKELHQYIDTNRTPLTSDNQEIHNLIQEFYTEYTSDLMKAGKYINHTLADIQAKDPDYLREYRNTPHISENHKKKIDKLLNKTYIN